MCQLTATNGVIAGGDWGEPNKPHTFRNWDHLQGITLAQQTALFAGTWYPGGDGIGTAAPIPAMTPVKSMLAGLTPEQAAALAVFDKVNAESFSGWFLRSSGMAFMEVESSFNPQAFREEPSGVASYGMMQVVDATAHGLGLVGDPRKDV